MAVFFFIIFSSSGQHDGNLLSHIMEIIWCPKVLAGSAQCGVNKSTGVEINNGQQRDTVKFR